MKKTYWVKKNPNSTVEWIEMDGRQFYGFIISPAGKDRYFIDCGTYKIEASHEQYRKWKRETNHSGYLQGFEDEVVILSLEALANDDVISGYEVIDLSVNIEDEVINNIDRQFLSEAVCTLPDDERWLINELYMREEPKTEREITEQTGIPQPTIHYRKNKILEKLKNVLIKIKKSQQ